MERHAAKQDGADDARTRTVAAKVLDAARECLHAAIARHPSETTQSRDLRASDAAFRRLSDCVQEYARVLGELGRDDRAVLDIMLAVLDDAAYPDEPHPAVRLAVADWTVEALARRSQSGGSAA